jgi:hypothetical protein
MFDYVTTDMEDLQAVVYAIATDLIDLAHDASLIDLEDISSADLELLFQMYVYVGTVAQTSSFEELEHPVDLYPFDPEDYYHISAFEELIQRNFEYELSSAELEAEMDRMSIYYGGSTELENYLYTLFLGYVYPEFPAE